jgi:hypothetical protein
MIVSEKKATSRWICQASHLNVRAAKACTHEGCEHTRPAILEPEAVADENAQAKLIAALTRTKPRPLEVSEPPHALPVSVARHMYDIHPFGVDLCASADANLFLPAYQQAYAEVSMEEHIDGSYWTVENDSFVHMEDIFGALPDGESVVLNPPFGNDFTKTLKGELTLTNWIRRLCDNIRLHPSARAWVILPVWDPLVRPETLFQLDRRKAVQLLAVYQGGVFDIQHPLWDTHSFRHCNEQEWATLHDCGVVCGWSA